MRLTGKRRARVEMAIEIVSDFIFWGGAVAIAVLFLVKVIHLG
jgi:hypothetical protein